MRVVTIRAFYLFDCKIIWALSADYYFLCNNIFSRKSCSGILVYLYIFNLKPHMKKCNGKSIRKNLSSPINPIAA